MTNSTESPAVITESQDVFLLMAARACTLKEKRLWRLDLNRSGRVLGCDDIRCADPDSYVVHPRAIFEGAFKRGAERIVLVHNHLDNGLELSDSDHILTGMMRIWGDQVGIPLFDHVVMTERSWVSFRDQGLI